MTDYYFLIDAINVLTPPAALGAGAGAATLLVGTVAFISGRRRRTALARFEDRLTHLAAGVSLLANTTEEGLRSVATEIARLASVAEQKPAAQQTVRERIAAAAGHGRSVQDIAASEQVSEGEVLLHLLLDKLKPEAIPTDAC